MKVLQINATYKSGSTGRIVHMIRKKLSEHGVEDWVACQYDKSGDCRVIGISNKVDMKMHALMSRITGKNANYSVRSTRRLLDLIDNVHPDIVHLHNLHNNYINLNILLDYLIQNKIKTILTLHDTWFFTGKCTHFSEIKCDRWIKGCHTCPQLKGDIPSWFFDKTRDMWKEKKGRFEKIRDLQVVGCSEWITSLAKKSLLSSGQFHTIHNGIDVQVFINIGKNLKEKIRFKDKFIIIGMANKWFLPQNEGLLEWLLDELEDDYHFIIIGKDGIDNNKVTYYKYIQNQDILATLYRTADVFINTTFEDTLPTVNLEAMACGTPVITYDSCGSPETITEETGIIIEKGNRQQLLSAIKTVRKFGKKSYTQACREHILKNYNSELQYEKYFELYCEK